MTTDLILKQSALTAYYLITFPSQASLEFFYCSSVPPKDFSRITLQTTTQTDKERSEKKIERERESGKENDRVRENIGLIYITCLFQSNMAIHQRGFQWQAITRPADSSACCWRPFRPRPQNNPWKQYLYIYYIFTQYLPRCKTISYLTINSPMLFFFYPSPCLIPAPPTLNLSACFLLCFLFSNGVFFFFASSVPQFNFYIFFSEKIPSPPSFFCLLYR